MAPGPMPGTKCEVTHPSPNKGTAVANTNPRVAGARCDRAARSAIPWVWNTRPGADGLCGRTETVPAHTLQATLAHVTFAHSCGRRLGSNESYYWPTRPRSPCPSVRGMKYANCRIRKGHPDKTNEEPTSGHDRPRHTDDLHRAWAGAQPCLANQLQPATQQAWPAGGEHIKDKETARQQQERKRRILSVPT